VPKWAARQASRQRACVGKEGKRGVCSSPQAGPQAKVSRRHETREVAVQSFFKRKRQRWQTKRMVEILPPPASTAAEPPFPSLRDSVFPVRVVGKYRRICIEGGVFISSAEQTSAAAQGVERKRVLRPGQTQQNASVPHRRQRGRRGRSLP